MWTPLASKVRMGSPVDAEVPQQFVRTLDIASRPGGGGGVAVAETLVSATLFVLFLGRVKQRLERSVLLYRLQQQALMAEAGTARSTVEVRGRGAPLHRCPR